MSGGGRFRGAVLALLGEAPAAPRAAPPPVASPVSPAAPARRWWANRFVLAAVVVLAFAAVASMIYLKRQSGFRQAERANVHQASLGRGAGYTQQASAPAGAPAPDRAPDRPEDKAPDPPPAAIPDAVFAQRMAAFGRPRAPVAAAGANAAGAGGREAEDGPTAFDDALRVSKPRGAKAIEVPHPHLKIAEGTAILCTMNTATDNGTGFVFGSCSVAEPVFGMEGTLPLFGKYSQITIRGERSAQNGEDRIFLTAANATVRIAGKRYMVDLVSAVGDSLGRTGVRGEVDTQDWRRMWNALQLGITGEAANVAGSALAQAGYPGAATTRAITGAGTTGIRYRTQIPVRHRLQEGELVVIQVNRVLDFSNQLQLALVD